MNFLRCNEREREGMLGPNILSVLSVYVCTFLRHNKTEKRPNILLELRFFP